VFISGATCDDIDNYNRTHEMLHILTSKANRDNDDASGFGRRWDDQDYQASSGYLFGPTDYPGIASGASRIVYFKPLLGIFNQSKYLPLMWGGFVLEFELVGTSTDPIISPPAGVADSDYTNANTSTAWEILDVRLIGDQVNLDSALQNSYSEHVLSGKTLPISYNTFITMQQAVSGTYITVNISRAVSRLKTFYFSLYSGDPVAGIERIYRCKCCCES